MEFQTLLETRRSVRSYLPGGKPDAETIKKLIAAAQEAPSWKNTETGRYHCVLSDEMTAKISGDMPATVQRHTQHERRLPRRNIRPRCLRLQRT